MKFQQLFPLSSCERLVKYSGQIMEYACQIFRKSKNTKKTPVNFFLSNNSSLRRSTPRQHYKVTRNDQLHKLITQLTCNYRHIEDLDISAKNKRLSRQDGGWYEFRRQLTYRATLRGNKIFIADRWFASSKRCSRCNQTKKEMLLSERVYHCDLEMDRDLNASQNLANLINTASSAGINACGQDGSVIMLQTLLQPAWQKQELSPV